jgi:hypothetical protein
MMGGPRIEKAGDRPVAPTTAALTDPPMEDMEEDLSRVFERFAKDEFRDSSPLYEHFSLAIAKDPGILSLAAHSRVGERVPNLLFAAVHFLLLKGEKHPLSLYYRNVSGFHASLAGSYPAFRSFCLDYHDQLRTLISARRVQTNEVSRSAVLLPAFALISHKSKGRPLYLVDIGASAGLNLLWDRYGYEYGEALRCGNTNSLVQIKCALRGAGVPPFSDTAPKISTRVGIDINPIDVRDPEAALWLKALIWPEHEKRAQLLDRAVQIARREPPTLIRGDGVESLPAVIDAVPEKSVLCIIRIFTQLTIVSHNRLSSLISEYGGKRDVFLISARPHAGDVSELHLVSIVNGIRTEECVAYFQNHGAWIEWLLTPERGDRLS